MFKIIKSISIAFAGCGLLLTAGGCVTTDDPATRMSEREDFRLLRENMSRIEGRLETMEMEYRRLFNEMESLKNATGSDDARARDAQARMDSIEARISALDAARERDRREIVDQLSARIAELMRSGRSSRKPGSSARAVSDTGYEHEVQTGETLSAIAAAYKVSVKVIVEANNLEDPDHLRKGQKLFIPQ